MDLPSDRPPTPLLEHHQPHPNPFTSPTSSPYEQSALGFDPYGFTRHYPAGASPQLNHPFTSPTFPSPEKSALGLDPYGLTRHHPAGAPPLLNLGLYQYQSLGANRSRDYDTLPTDIRYSPDNPYAYSSITEQSPRGLYPTFPYAPLPPPAPFEPSAYSLQAAYPSPSFAWSTPTIHPSHSPFPGQLPRVPPYPASPYTLLSQPGGFNPAAYPLQAALPSPSLNWPLQATRPSPTFAWSDPNPIAHTPSPYIHIPSPAPSEGQAPGEDNSGNHPPLDPNRGYYPTRQRPGVFPATVSPAFICSFPMEMDASQSFSDLMAGSRTSRSSSTSSDEDSAGFPSTPATPATRPSRSFQAYGPTPQRHNNTATSSNTAPRASASRSMTSRAKPKPKSKPRRRSLPARTKPQAPPLHSRAYSYHHPPSDRSPNDIDDDIREYINTPSRLTLGERRITVMTPKVGQKSYRAEKRFLCPPPQALMIGSGWWSTSADGTMRPPSVNISLDCETRNDDAICSWSSLDGQDMSDEIGAAEMNEDMPFFGAAPGKDLFISPKSSDSAVKALVMVTAYDSEPEAIGTFESKEIRVISKAPKGKTVKSCDHVLHGSTIALYYRPKGNSAETRYLSVVPDSTRVYGSDGVPATDAYPPSTSSRSTFFTGITVDKAVWESFIVWIVEPSGHNGPNSNLPLHPGWPIAPPTALPTGPGSPPLSLRYNTTIILQSVQTGCCSLTLVIRRIDDNADAVGQDGTFGLAGHCAPRGEQQGDFVSQTHKAAFELYNAGSGHLPEGRGAYWMGWEGDDAKEQWVPIERHWATASTPKPRTGTHTITPASGHGVLPLTPISTAINRHLAPISPISSEPEASDYLEYCSRLATSSSMTPAQPWPTDGGPVKRQRSNSSGRIDVGGHYHSSGNASRKSSQSSMLDAWDALPFAYAAAPPPPRDHMFWTVAVGETCAWTIVGTEHTTYTFYTPYENLRGPIAPYPTVTNILPYNVTAEMGSHQCGLDSPTVPPVHLFGQGFQTQAGSTHRYNVFYGDEKAEHTTVMSETEVVTSQPQMTGPGGKEVFLVRDDGRVIVPTGLWYAPSAL